MVERYVRDVEAVCSNHITAPQVFLFLAFVFALKAGVFFVNAIQVGVTK